MSVLPSLIAALERAAGDTLVLRSGERPHVVSGDTRHDVGSSTLSVKAVEALAAQILSPEGQKELEHSLRVEEVLAVEVAEGSLTARAERAGSDLFVELRRHRRNAAAAHPTEPPTPAPSAPVAVTSLVAQVPEPEPEVPRIEAPPATLAPAAPARAAEEVPVPVIERFDGADTHHVPQHATPVPVIARQIDEPVPADDPAAGMPIAEPARVERLAPVDEPHATMRQPSTFLSPPIEPDASSRPEARRQPSMRGAEPWARGNEPRTPNADVRLTSRESRMHEPEPHVRAVADVAVDGSDFDDLLIAAARRGATAVYIRANQVPSARIDERLLPLDVDAVSAAALQQVLTACSSGQDGWQSGGDGVWLQDFEHVGPVRCYAFADHAGDGLVVHLSPRSSASGLQKHIPRQVRRSCESEDGLVVVAAGSQRDLLAMTASVTELAGGARGGFVICLEPANGLPHRVAGAFVSERRWNGSVNDAVLAVRRAAHEGPDILVVVPDDASVAQEVVAAAGAPGRLVVLGIVAPTALGALEAIVSSADRDREPQVRRAVASSLRAAFSYRGLRRLGGGRTTVQDVVIGTTDVRARLDRGDFSGIEQVQRQGTEGMRTLDAALARAVARRQVALRQAASCAANRSELITLTRHDVRERRRLAREQRPGERRPGVLRAITVG